MKKIFLVMFIFLSSGITTKVLADRFIPEFDKMSNIKCTIKEEIYEKDGQLVTQNVYYRYYKLDDENQKIYLQKAPIDKILFYDENKIAFKSQHLTDDFIIQSDVTIDRTTNSIKSISTIEYDNEIFQPRKAVGRGTCEPINL